MSRGILVIEDETTLANNIKRYLERHDYEVRIAGHRLEATAIGEPVDRARHRPAVEVKGATYAELSVARREDGPWVAQCVVDV